MNSCTSSILNDLNASQSAAVQAPDGSTLVLAGAGSGKTRVITRRIAWHLAHGVPADEITAMTFTNKAAREMSDRVRGRVDDVPFIGTFHRFGLWVLRRHRKRLGYARQPNLIDPGDQMGILRETLKELGIPPGSWNLHDAMDLVLEGRTSKAIEGHVRFRRPHGLAPVGVELVDRFEERLKSLNAVDFDALILLPIVLLRKHPDLAQKVRKRTRYLLVDEFQDTNVAQMELVRKLVGDDGTLMAVGDEDQSIYAFRGARVENILQFESSFPGCRIIRLEENYRCADQILQLANQVIAQNENRTDKRLKVMSPHTGKVNLIGLSSPETEAEFVGDRIVDAMHRGLDLNEIAVLYRANRQAQPLELALAAKNIPYRRIGGISFFERKEVRDALAWLALLVDRNDDNSFRRAVQAPSRGVGAASLSRLEAHAEQNRCSLMDAAEALVLQTGELPRTGEAGLKEMLGQVKVARATLRNENAPAAFLHILNLIKYRDHLLEQADAPIEGSKRYGRILSLGDLLKTYLEVDPVLGTRAFLDDLLLGGRNDEPDEADVQATVTLMTLHAAKGLEFDRVFIVGLEEGIIPHERSLSTASGLAEELRLLYVGITRTKLSLLLSYVRKRPQGGAVGEERLSRFLRDVGIRPRIMNSAHDLTAEESRAKIRQIDNLRDLLKGTNG